MAPWNKYGPTAARRHGKPGRELRPRSVTIDMHSHVGVAEAAKFVEPHLDWATIPLAHFATPETKALTAKQEADISGRAGIDRRLADLDEMGIDIQLIGLKRQMGRIAIAQLHVAADDERTTLKI